MHVTGSVVVRIEKISVLGNFRAISRDELFEDKRLEKPCRMGEVPFRWAHVRHRLHDAVFWFEICAKTVGEISDLMKTSKQALNAR